MTKPASQRVDMRRLMPKTAEWVDAKRKEFGAERVNACLKRALAGEEGAFYAIEAGHVLGVPFPPTAPESRWQDFAIATGSGFAAFIALPKVKDMPC